MTKEEIGAILKELRLQSGKTQQQVAELINRKQQIIGHWETGYSQPDANTLFLLCDIYGASIDAAFGFSECDNTKVATPEEMRIISKYRKLDERGKKAVCDTLAREYSYIEEQADSTSGKEQGVLSETHEVISDEQEKATLHAKLDEELTKEKKQAAKVFSAKESDVG